MGLFPQQFIDDLRLQANIVQVIQDYVPLKKVGRKHKGLCPFHAEKTPSFQVDEALGFFHCFGCKAGGDVFQFLILHEKVDFPEAVRVLAQKFGVSLPEIDPGDRSDDGRRDAALRETLLRVHEVAAAYFRAQLASAAGQHARQQLRERGVSAATIDALGLGYAPNTRAGLKPELLQQGFAEELLIQSGLLVRRETGEVVDRFRQRLMIPICRDAGPVIAFGGRQLDPDQGGPKYLNSPETPIYSKSRTLYGLHLTKPLIRKAGYAVLVEGYFDFAQVYQGQAAPVVASCGTAVTPQQAQLLRRFTSKVVLSFDPDAAGEGAASRSCELLVSHGFDVNVLELEKGEDPDTFVRRRGPEAYREKLRSSRPYLEYLLDRAAVGLRLSHDEPRRQFLEKMLAVAAQIPDPVVRDQFADRIAHKARITEEVVRREIRRAAVARQTTLTERQLPAPGHAKQAEKGLIWALFHRASDARSALVDLDAADLEHLTGREVFEVAQSLHDCPTEQLPSELLRRLSTMSVQLVSAIAGETTAPVTGPDDLGDCVRILKRLRCERDRASIQREIDRLQGLGPSEHGDAINLLLNQKRQLAQRIEELVR